MKKINMILWVLTTVILLTACGKQQDVSESVVLENETDAVEAIEQDDIDNSQETEEIVYDKTGPFLMTVDAAYNIAGFGIMVRGTIERGQLNLYTELNLVDESGTLPTTITGIHTGNNALDVAEEGSHVCLRLHGLSRTDLDAGEVISNENFSMTVEQVFSASEPGTSSNTYAIGVVESGQVRVEDVVEITGLVDARKTVIDGIQTYCDYIEYAEAGDSVLLLLRGISIDQVQAGQTLEQIE